MTIATLGDLATAFRQHVTYHKAVQAAAGGVWFSLSLSTSGLPVAISTVSNTTTGVVPVMSDTGYPSIQTFSGVGYISALEAHSLFESGSTNSQRFMLYDRLWHAGPISAVSGTVTFGSQPSYSSRIPNGDYRGTQIWLESVSQSGAPTITITYTNSAGVAGQSSAFAIANAGGTSGVMRQFPLAPGDSGLQKIESISVTGGTSGNVNIVVVRPLVHGRVEAGGFAASYGLDQTGLPIVYADSALAVMVNSDNSGNGPLALDIEISAA